MTKDSDVKARRYFGTDGIRCEANRGLLAPAAIVDIGRAMGRRVRLRKDGVAGTGGPQGLEGPRVLLVRDTRISGAMIGSLLTGALLAEGVHVLDGGVLPTPAAALVARRLRLPMGIVISASHNPMPDNGIKIFGPHGRKLDDDEEARLEEEIDRGDAPAGPVGAGLGRHVRFPEASRLYVDEIAGEIMEGSGLCGLRVLADCANGAASAVAPEILRRAGADVTAVHASPDGVNINVDCGVFHVEDLAGRVRAGGFDLAMALDGDGDRVILVDEDGRVLDGDSILAILATDWIASGRLRGGCIVATVMSNLGLDAAVRPAGVRVETCPVGDRAVAEKMSATDAVLGGEQSGHIVIRRGDRWYGDGLVTALSVMRIARESGRRVSELGALMRRFPQVLVNVSVERKPPFDTLERVRRELVAAEGVLAGRGRVLLRYSGTEPLARVMMEGPDETEIRALADRVAEAIRLEIGRS